jgi:hypothetical protein
MVRYRVKPDQVEANETLVRAVYAELADKQPAGLRYETFKLDDGVTFVHLAFHEDGFAGLGTFDAFNEFTKDVRDRCAEPPVTSTVERIGGFGVGRAGLEPATDGL